MSFWNALLRRSTLAAVAATAVLLASASVPVHADPQGPSATDEQITKLVAYLIQNEHLSKRPSTTISRRVFWTASSRRSTR